MTDITTVLRHARALIDKCGWIKGSMGDPENGFCIAGAIAFSSGGREEVMRTALACVGRAIGGYSADDVPRWNDAEDRRREDVLRMLDEAVAYAAQTSTACECPSCVARGAMTVTGVSKTQMTMTKEAMEDAAAAMAHMPSLGVTFKSMFINGKELPGLGDFELPPIKADKKKTRRKKAAKAPKPQLADVLA